MSKKDNFSQAMFEMFGLGKAPEDNEEDLDDIQQLENLSADDMRPETEAPVGEIPVVEDIPVTFTPEPSVFDEIPGPASDAWPSVEEHVPAAEPVSAPAAPAAVPTPAPEPVRATPVRRANCTYFAEGTSMEGTLRSDSDVEIVGDFKGEIASDGKVTIHSNTQSSIAAAELVLIDCALTGDAMISGDVSINERSSVTGNIRATNIVCSGIIKGNLNVTGNIALTENAQIVGDIRTGTLAMSRGARVSGKIDMGGN